MFLKCEVEEIWDVVESYVPKKSIDAVERIKQKAKQTDYDKKMVSYNNKAMHILFCPLRKTQLNIVQQCESAHRIWRNLQITYQGTSQVKENKISLLVQKYKLFKMEEEEYIQNMFNRFNDIINGLKSLGKTYINQELVRKILRSWPKSWTSKKCAILEAKDLNSLPLKELLGFYSPMK